MKVNLALWRKDEIVKAWNYRCKHKHNGLAHIQCYTRHAELGERVGFLDIEASNLNANFGIVLSWCIKEEGGDIISGLILPEELQNEKYDKRILKELSDAMKGFDRLVTYYGGDRRFDLPFIRTRCVHYGIDFPVYQSVYHTDAYSIVRNKLRLHRNSLQAACDFLDIPSKMHRLDSKIWLRCLSGNKKALAHVLEHNKEDVISTEKLWEKIKDYVRITGTSL